MTRLLAPSPTLSSRTRIEGFTGEWAFLGDVPQGSDRPDDPDVHARAEAWEHWSQDIRIYRQWVLRELEAHPELERIEWLKCQNDIAYFINVYGWIFEARGNRGRGGYTPWLLFERPVRIGDVVTIDQIVVEVEVIIILVILVEIVVIIVVEVVVVLVVIEVELVIELIIIELVILLVEIVVLVEWLLVQVVVAAPRCLRRRQRLELA